MSFPRWCSAALLSISTTCIAILGRTAFDWSVGPAPAFVAPFFLPVIFTALCFGGKWGLLTTVANTLIVAYCFTPPTFGLAIRTLEDQIRIGTFAVLSTALSVLAGSLRYYRTKIDQESRLVQKKIAKALTESDQKFRAVFHAQFQFIGLMSPDGVLLDANRTALAAAGVTEDQVIGKPFWETVWWSHDPVQQQRLRDAIHHATAGRRDRFEASHPRADGSIMWVDFSLTPYFHDGHVVLLIPEGRDITERKQAEASVRESEQRFQSFMTHAPIAAWIADADSRGVYTSPGFDRLLGLPPGAYHGRIPTELWPTDFAEAYVENNRRVLADGAVVETEEPFVRIDGRTGWSHVVKFPIYGLHGERLVGGVAIDITVRKNAEASLRANEERFRLAVEATGMGVWDSIVPFAEFGWDNRLKLIFGLPPDTVVDTATMFNRIHPDDRESALAAHYQAVNPVGSGVLKAEFRINAPDGERWLAAWGQTVFDNLPAGRTASRSVGVVLDVTERIMAERRLAESELLFRAAMEGSLDAIYFLTSERDSKGKITDFCFAELNQRGCELLSLTREQVIGKRLCEILPQQRSEGYFDKYVDVVATGQPLEEEFTRSSTDGENAMWYRHQVVRVKDGVTITTQDITARKQFESALKLSEERFRRLVDGVANHAIFMLDTEGYVISWNRGAQQIKGYTTEEICGRHFSVFYTPEAVSAGHPQKELAMAMAEGRYHEEGLRVRKDGAQFWADVTISTLYDDLGKHVGFVKFTHDISDRKASERLLRQSLKEKEVMLKEIHHRVKNNLQIVSALLELQAGYTSNKAVVEMFEESQARVKSMALIHERLYMSGDFAGVNFAEYVRQLADDLYRTYKVTDDNIELKIEVDIPLVPIDIAIPCGILLNELISNCLKHAFKNVTKGSIWVSITSDGQAMVLSVSDDGIGFERDIDFRNSATFGLQLVNTLVEQLNGQAEMLTSPGTKFTVRFRN